MGGCLQVRYKYHLQILYSSSKQSARSLNQSFLMHCQVKSPGGVERVDGTFIHLHIPISAGWDALHSSTPQGSLLSPSPEHSGPRYALKGKFTLELV